MTVSVTAQQIVHVARPLTDTFHADIREFGHPAVLSVSSVQNSLSLLLLEHHPGERHSVLLPVIL